MWRIVRSSIRRLPAIGLAFALALPVTCLADADERTGSVTAAARQILTDAGVQGGLIAHLGCGDGKLTAALRLNDAYLVQGWDTDPDNVQRARRHIHSRKLYGSVTADRLDGARLPYIDNLVNLVVAEAPGDVPTKEILRVLCPEGVALIQRDGKWTKTVKPRPDAIDHWTHYLHDASNNAVAHDTEIGPPGRLQWIGSPRYSRHHDRMSSVSAVVSAGGRVFYIFDAASPASILLPPKWTLIARDAFNGTVLWKRSLQNWHTHLWPLKSGPAQLPRRLVAEGDRVYVTLGIDTALTALDGATGEVVREYEGTKGTEEILLADGVLVLLVNPNAKPPAFADAQRIKTAYRSKFWDEEPRQIMAVRANSGEVLWSGEHRVLPVTLAADSGRVVFHNGESVVCLDGKTGDENWRSKPVPRSKEIWSFYAPTLVLYENVVLFSGGETAGLQTGSWYTSGEDTLTALSANDGRELWTAYHPPSGYRSPEDLLVVDGLVWTGETTSGRAVGVFSGRDPQTGEVKREFPPDVETYWFHHRCYRGKATDKYLLMARSGTEFLDVRQQNWDTNHWVRGACLYGIMPANGLIYAPQHPCACYLEAKLSGFTALATATSSRLPETLPGHASRLERGPAYESIPETPAHPQDWPTFRHDAARSGRASTPVPETLHSKWERKLGGPLSSPVVANGQVFVAQMDAHTVQALDAESGKTEWQFTAGGRVDSPPTFHQGRVLFGAADGWVYCLRASDGALAWRFLAAPNDERMTYFEQVESVWPVSGSVLVQQGAVYCVSGRSMFVDGGLRLWRLDPQTGRVLSETVLDENEAASGKDLQEFVSWLNMPTALPDILSSDGRLVYMRSQPFQLDGTRLPLKPFPMGPDADRGAPPATQLEIHSHLFSPTGFLDDTWWHRTYWMYGSTFVSGWCGYFLAGKSAPAGRILVFDEERVYGFGRKPQYFRWTTPIEHHLFAARKRARPPGKPAGEANETRVRVKKSPSLDPTGKPLSIAAWVKAEKANGVILARGGGTQGYAVSVQGGRPKFTVRASGEIATITAKRSITGRWTHIAAVLDDKQQMRLYVDGQPTASGRASGFLASDPQEALELGADEGSAVGEYQTPHAFSGIVDEVLLFHRALTPDEIKRTAEQQAAPSSDQLVLAYDFDTQKATDVSGNENHGELADSQMVRGKKGGAVRFVGGAPRVADYHVIHDWVQDLPLFGRALLLADGKLFVAGPVDSIDEEDAYRQIDNPEIRRKLTAQSRALQGLKGARLRAVSTDNGHTLSEQALDASPVFDGMAAARGRLYLSTQAGTVQCLSGE